MRIYHLWILILFFGSSSLWAQVIPYPQSFKTGKGSALIKIKPTYHPFALIQKNLESIAGIEFVARGEENLEIKIKDPVLKIPAFKIDESYELTFANSKILIKAPNEFGAFYALETLKQLYAHYEGKLPAFTIKDSPRFPWRGLLIDVARNWIELGTLKRQIDLMAAVKLNVLHLHLSDDQAFRLESKVYPKLHQNNADKKFYSQEEIKELINYAAQKNIRVVPEFDVPGHTSSILAVYPELASVPGLNKPSKKYGPHDEAMNPLSSKTHEFLEKLFLEMAAIFPDDFFHVGGDEVTGKHWLANTEISSYMQTNNITDTTGLQFQFTRRMEALMKKLGKKMIAWDEVLKEKEHLDSAAQIWRGPKFGRQALEIKMPVIYSYGYYLDLQLSSERHYQQDPTFDMNLPKDPTLLWGGEACLWSERTPDELVTNRIWPRAMAVAERLWSVRTKNDVEDFYDRQSKLSHLLKLENPLLDQRLQAEAKHLNITQESLKDFFSWLEPGKFYSQHRYRIITTETSWNMWVDLLPSESVKATRLNWLFEKWFKTRKKSELLELQEEINSWNTISTSFISLESHDFKEKKDLLALAKDLGALSRIAYDALNYLNSDERPGHTWLMENRTKLGMMGHIRGGLQPAMHSLVEKMVFKVGTKKSLPSR